MLDLDKNQTQSQTVENLVHVIKLIQMSKNWLINDSILKNTTYKSKSNIEMQYQIQA